MASGDNDKQVETWLLKQGNHHLDRDTIGKVREELKRLPEEFFKDLPEKVQAYWREMHSLESEAANVAKMVES